MILAGGRGARMAAGRNKALLPLGGKPLLRHSLDTLRACCDRVLVVSAAADLADVRRLAPAGTLVVEGGASRQGSEWNALRALAADLAEDDVVALHDAARPLVTAADVRAVLAAAAEHGAAMLAAPSGLPALELAAEASVLAGVYPAAELWRAQTPQAARAGWLLDAYRQAEGVFDGTDTAAVLARAGYPVRIVPATGENTKVTVPADLPLAEALLSRRDVSGA